jgi:hypothetical protein
MGAGNLRGWYAPNAYYYSKEANKHDIRFIQKPSDPTESVAWYFWKLPPFKVTFFTRSIVWVLYALHQLTAWGIIYWTQKHKPEYSTSLRNFNWIALSVNAIFHLLHLIQTHWTYDALAQDTPIASSQGSVVMLLCFVFIIEYLDRGAVAAYPALTGDKRTAYRSFTQLIRKYHGYAFAWAAIYTFWYHPMENTYGHALGFIHTSLIMLQGSLMYTKAHLNKIWIVGLESFVTLHSGVIAYQTSGFTSRLWPMFVFGFFMNFAWNQIYDIWTPMWRKTTFIVRSLPIVGYIIITIVGYYQISAENMGRMNEIIRIPVIDVIFCLFMLGCLQIINPIYDNVKVWKFWDSLFGKCVAISLAILTYVIIILIGVILHYTVQLHVMIGMIILVLIYTVGCTISFALIGLSLGQRQSHVD